MSRDEGWPGPLTAADEAANPGWPPIAPAAPLALLCAELREQYDRTRCVDLSCGRCWGGQRPGPAVEA